MRGDGHALGLFYFKIYASAWFVIVCVGLADAAGH